MKLNVPPTKSSSLSITRELAFALEGHDMLEQKRQILVLELMKYVESARREQAEVDDLLQAAHDQLRQAAMRVGSHALTRDAIATPQSTSVNISERRVMGLSVPEITSEHPPLQPSFAFSGGTVKSDEVMQAFSKALEAVSRLAQTQNAVFRLANDLRKTQRRVNALEKMFIPDYRETLEYINATLEEREREQFVILRIIRNKLRAAGAQPRQEE